MLTCYTILDPIGLSEQSKIALEQVERIAVLTKGEQHNLLYIIVKCP